MGHITHEWSAVDDPVLPEITDEELVRRFGVFDLLFDRKGYRRVDMSPSGGRSQIQMLRNMSCIWSPTLAEPVTFGGEARAVPFFVTCGYHGMFKPSVAEVLSQSPAEELEKAGFNSFYIGDHIEILRSGRYQRATAYFVRVRKAGD